jgi:DNA replication protein DnaC
MTTQPDPITPSVSDRKADTPVMDTTHPDTTSLVEGSEGQMVPALPTTTQTREQYERALAEAERIEAERIADEKARADARAASLLAKAKHLMENAAILTPKEKLPGDDHSASWQDPREAQNEGIMRAWRESVTAANKAALAAWQLADVQDPFAKRVLGQFIDALDEPFPVKLNVVLVGPTRTGKTSSAIAAGHYAVRRDRPIRTMFVTHRQFLDRMDYTNKPERKAEQDAYLRRLNDAKLLIVDDFGAALDPTKAVTSFVNTHTLALVGSRLEAGKATIITTNLNKEQLLTMFDARIVGRITESAVPVPLRTVLADQIDF